MSTISGACWAIQRNTENHLRARIAAMGVEDGTLARLRREHAKLQALSRANDQRPSAASDLNGSIDGGDSGASREGGPSLRIGSWAAPGDWRPCGNATPDAAIESTLFAAAHGDVSSLKATLEFDDNAIAKAESILAELPDSSRRQYASPEDLLAVIVAGSIPLDSAQLVGKSDGICEAKKRGRLHSSGVHFSASRSRWVAISDSSQHHRSDWGAVTLRPEVGRPGGLQFFLGGRPLKASRARPTP
jgi:hypothetical protein